MNAETKTDQPEKKVLTGLDGATMQGNSIVDADTTLYTHPEIGKIYAKWTRDGLQLIIGSEIMTAKDSTPEFTKLSGILDASTEVKLDETEV